MKNKYYVIRKNGKVCLPGEYLSSSDSSELMRICIEREALGKEANNNSDKPEYLSYANKLGFNWEENSSIGFLQYDYKANFIFRLVQEYARYLVGNIGIPIYEVRGSNFFDLKHPVVKSYAGLFGDRLFQFKSNDDELVMSYDASYPQFNLASMYRINEKQLPYAHFSISDCYRYEQSGECMLLFRGRRFFMPDLHPYYKDLEQAWEGYFKIEKQIEKGFKLANREYVNLAKVSSMSNWEKYKEQIKNIAINGNKEMLVEVKMDGEDRYWIIDIDYSIIDQLKQVREIGCIQIDIGNAKRLGIKYQDSEGDYQNPVIIHAAVPGGIERYIYMMLDDMKNFPVYFSPIQLRIIPVSQKFSDYAVSLAKKFPDIRIDIDDRAESVGKKIKQSHEDLVPFNLVVGEKEVKSKIIPIELENVVKEIRLKCKGLPIIHNSLPLLVSKGIK